jgi:hypothetical protein
MFKLHKDELKKIGGDFEERVNEAATQFVASDLNTFLDNGRKVFKKKVKLAHLFLLFVCIFNEYFLS